MTGATVANFVCLAAAHGEVLRRVGWDVERDGLFGAPAVTVPIGEEAHFRSARCTGAACARARGAWVHVDGAFGLWARASAAHTSLADGVELADSWATDGHKWLQTPYDCGYAIVRDAEAHRRAMVIAASYLPSVGEGERDPSHFVPELSRRARGFATWAMLRHLGRAGIAAMVDRHCRLARLIAERVSAEPGIAVLNDVVLNQAILRFGDDDARTLATIARLQADGVAYAGGAKWRGKWVMRISVSGWPTTDGDALRTVDAIVAAWRSSK